MIDIVFLFLVFCVGFVSVGVLGEKWNKKDVVTTIDNKVQRMRNHNNPITRNIDVEFDKNVKTAEIDTDEKVMYLNPEDIYNEVTDTIKTVYNVKDNELLKEFGIDKAETYSGDSKYVGNKVIDSILNHEIGHRISEASEVDAELYRSMRNGYDELKKEDKLEYAVSFYNLVKNGADKGFETAKETYKLLKEQYGATVEPIKDLVNAMLDASENVSYKSKRFID
ncbi:MAG: hypothetical protein KAI18_01865 [Candidatus Aenigmarchaeota archaeon]|nr:hypothetical protein [Candidatus Aenigmarchaeota archaeon]